MSENIPSIPDTTTPETNGPDTSAKAEVVNIGFAPEKGESIEDMFGPKPAETEKTTGTSINFSPYTGEDVSKPEYFETGADLNKYTEYTQYFSDPSARDARAARAQSAGEQLFNGLYQGVVGEIIGGTLEGLGSFGMGPNGEKTLLFELGNSIRDFTEEAHIFEQEPGAAFAFNDVAWWSKNIPSLLSTLSMFIPGAAVGKGASMLGKAALKVRRAQRVQANVRKAEAAAKASGQAFDKASALAAANRLESMRLGQLERRLQTVATGVGMRHAENIREATDVAYRAEKEFLESDTSLEQMKGTEAYSSFIQSKGREPGTKGELAIFVGGAAAKRSYAVNSANLVFDITQASLIFKPARTVTRGAVKKATGKEVKEAAEKVGKNVVQESAKRTRIQKLGEYLAPVAPLAINMASEGAEEAVNFIGSEEGIAYAERLRGIDTGSFGDRLGDYMNDSHLWESAFFGALGGGVFHALGTSYGKKQNALLQAYKEREALVTGYAEALKNAETDEEVAAIKSQFIHNLGMTAAQQGRVDQLVEQLNDDSYIEHLAQQGYGSVEELQAAREAMIEQVLSAEKEYTQAMDWARSQGLSGMALGSFLQETMNTSARMYALNKRLEETKDAPALSKEEGLAVKMGVLEMLKNQQGDNPAYKNVIAKLEEEVKAEKEAGVDISAVDAGNVNQKAIDNLTLSYLKEALESERALQQSDNAAARYTKQGEEATKKAIEKLKRQRSKHISETEDTKYLEDVIKAAQKNNDKETENLAQTRLNEIKAQKQREADVDALSNQTHPHPNSDEGQLSLFPEEEPENDNGRSVEEQLDEDPTAVTAEEFKDFVDNGTVQPKRVQQIAEKIKQGEQLTAQEEAMRQEVAEQIEALLNKEEGSPGQRSRRDVTPIQERIENMTKPQAEELLTQLLAEQEALRKEKKSLRSKAKRRQDKGQEEEASQLLQDADVVVEDLAEVASDIKILKEAIKEMPEETTEETTDETTDDPSYPEDEKFEETQEKLYDELKPKMFGLSTLIHKPESPKIHKTTLASQVGNPEANITPEFLDDLIKTLQKLKNRSDEDLLNTPIKRVVEYLETQGITVSELSSKQFDSIQNAAYFGYFTPDDVRRVLQNTIIQTQMLKEHLQKERDRVTDPALEAPRGEIITQLMNDMQMEFAEALVIGPAHTPFFSNDPFFDWMLPGDQTSLVLNDNTAEAYEALQKALQGRGKLVIRKQKSNYADRFDPDASVVTLNEGASLRKATRLKQRGYIDTVGKNVVIDARDADRTAYQIVAQVDGKEVVVGYIPQVTTILKHAKKLQEDYLAANEGLRSEKDWLAIDPKDDPRGRKFTGLLISGSNAHLSALHAVNAASKVLELREYLSQLENDVDVTSSVANRTALDNKPVRGSLLRPGPLATATISSDPVIMEAIETHGIAVLMRNKDGNVLLVNPVTGEKVDGMPYQDGVGINSITREKEVKFGLGHVFIPVPDPVSNRILWVRVNDVPKLSSMGPQGSHSVNDILANSIKNAIESKDLKAIHAAVGKFTSVIEVTNKTPLPKGYSGAAIEKGGNIVFYDSGEVIGQIKPDFSTSKNLYIALGRLPYMMPIAKSSTDTTVFHVDGADTNIIESYLAAAKLPVGKVQKRVTDENGKVQLKTIGYTHTLGSVRKPQGYQSSSFFPDTQTTQLPLRIEGAAVPKSVDVTSEDPSVPKSSDETVDPNNGDLFGDDADFLTLERAAASKTTRKSTTSEQKEAEDWWEKNLPHVPFRRVKGLITRGGKTGYGIWHNGMVSVSDAAVVGTEYHEAWHAVLDTYLSPARKAKLFAEAEKRYGKLGEEELEEKLAEAFREYMLTNGKSMQEKSGIRRFFSELLELVKALFNRGKGDIDFQALRVMQSINRGKYAYRPDSRTKNWLTRWKQAPAMDAVEMAELEQSIPFVINTVVKRYIHAISGMSTAEATAYLDKLPQFNDRPSLKEGLIKIKDQLQDALQTEEDGSTTVDRKAIKELSKTVLDLVFEPNGLMEAVIVRTAGSREDVDEGVLDRLHDNAELIAQTFAEDPQIQRDLYKILSIDSSTGTTSNEQYGDMSMSEINPMDKVPAAVKAFISSQPYLSSEIIQAIQEEVKKEFINPNTDIPKRVAALLEEQGKVGIDRMTKFGLPRRMNFNEVYPYLLHHLHDSTSPQDMIDKMTQLSRYNPNIGLLVVKLQASKDSELINQFYVGIKRASTAEVNVREVDRYSPSTDRYVKVKETSVKEVLPPATSLRLRYSNSVASRVRVIQQDPNNLAKIKNYVKNPGNYTPKGLQTLMEKLGFPINDGVRIMSLSLSITEIKQALEKLEAIAKETDTDQLNKQLYRFIKETHLAESDMSSVNPRYLNHKGKYVYGYMNPSYATEEIERLQSSNEHIKERLTSDPRLKNSEWTIQLKDKSLNYKRFGGYNGVPYNDMDMETRLRYDIEILKQGYVAIPTPSDADNSLLVSTTWMGHRGGNQLKGEELKNHQRQILINIWKSEKNSSDPKGSIPGLKEAQTADEALAIFRAEMSREADALIEKFEHGTGKTIFESRNEAIQHVTGVYVSNWNVAHWVGGNFNEFQKTDKNGKDITVLNFQKRFKHVLSPGQTSSDLGTFKMVTIAEPIKIVDKFGRRSKVKIDRADGQSYVTLAHYRRILKAHGEWNPHVERVIQKAEKGQPLSRTEAYLLKPYKPFYYGRVGNKGHQLKNSVVPLLPPYEGQPPQSPELEKMRQWMEDNKIDQVNMKSAHKVGLEKDQLVTMWNDDNQFVEPNMGKDDLDNIIPFNAERAIIELPMQHHRNQVHITEHMKNEDTIGFGTQPSKLITSNLASYTGISHNGKTVTGQQMKEMLVAKEQEMLEQKLAEMRSALFTKEGDAVDINKVKEWVADNLGDGVSDAVLATLKSGNPINQALIEGPIVQAIKSGIQREFKKMRVAGGMQVQVSDLGRNNGIDGTLKGMRVETVGGTSSLAAAEKALNKAIVNYLKENGPFLDVTLKKIENNEGVVRQLKNGDTEVVPASDVIEYALSGMLKKHSNDIKAMSFVDVQNFNEIVKILGDPEYVVGEEEDYDALNSFMETIAPGTNYKNPTREGGETVVKPAEIMTSRKFLPKKYRDMSIEEIRAIDPEALQMIVYRVPAEGKNSMAVVEVVEFLPDGQDGMVVPAEFVEQMGSDFDIDKLFVTWKFQPNRKGKLSPYRKASNEYFDLTKSVLMDSEVLNQEVLVPQGFDRIKAFRNSVVARNDSRTFPKIGNIDQYLLVRPYNAMTHLQLSQDNIAGIGLKGIAAKNNVFWINMQREGIKLRRQGRTYDFGKISRERLLWNAESVAASMDGAKDPVWGEMGIDSKNFTVFQDIALLKELEGDLTPNNSAWELVQNPYVKDLITGKIQYKTLRKKIRDGELKLSEKAIIQIEEYQDYVRNIAPVLRSAKAATRFQEDKLQDMDNGMLQYLKRQALAATVSPEELSKDITISAEDLAMLTSEEFQVLDANNNPVEIIDLNVNRANAEIVRHTDYILQALGVAFYEKGYAAYFNYDYQTHQRANAKSSAEMFLGTKQIVGGPLGIRASKDTRQPFDPAVPEEWSLQNFLEFFSTPEGRAILAQNPDLNYVVNNLYPRSEQPYTAIHMGVEYKYDRINVVNLDDPVLRKKFKDTWTRLLENTDAEMNFNDVNLAAALGHTMIKYEAARSGFKFGAQYLTSALPDGIVESLPNPGPIDLMSSLAFVNATQFRSVPLASGDTSAGRERNAMFSNQTVRTENRVFFSLSENGESVRTFITIDKNLGDSIGLRSLEDYKNEAVENALRVEQYKEAQRKKSKLTFGQSESGRTTGEKADLLQRKFAANGIYVEVVFDESMDEAGDVEFDGEKGVIRLNPKKLGSDTVIHEFGHIYVELLGYNDPMVQRAIAELRGSKLYKEIETLYPELSTRDLEMEVLVTAIGQEGNKVFEEKKQESRFKTLLNKLFRKLGIKLNTNQTAVRQLAVDMLSDSPILKNRRAVFKAQQRIKNNLNATDLAIAVADEIAERVDHARRLGMTSTEQNEMLDRWARSAVTLRGHSKVQESALDTLSQEIEDTLLDINYLMNNVDGYLEKVSVNPEFTTADVQFFNEAYQLLQMATTFNQSIISFNADSNPSLSREAVAKFKGTQGRLTVALQELDKKVSDAISNKMKAQNFGDQKLAEIETNIFHLAGTDLASMVVDATRLESGTLGMKEQKNIILQLTDKLIKRVIQSSELEAKEAMANLNQVLDNLEKSGHSLSDLVDKTGRAFVSPIKDSFFEARARARDVRIWDAENMELEYTEEYYKQWLYASKLADIERVRNLIARLEEAKRNKTITEGDEILLAESIEDLSNMEIARQNFLKFHEPVFDMDSYLADRDAAKRESAEALAEFDQAFSFKPGRPKFKTKYHTDNKFVVRDKYKNPNWSGKPEPQKRWRNEEYAELPQEVRDALIEIKTIMREAYGKDHPFFEQNLLPQMPVGESKTVKERIAEITTLPESQPIAERQDSVGNRVFVRGDLRTMKRADKGVEIESDLRKILPEFIKEAQAAKAANTIETFALSTRDQLAKTELIVPNRGKTLIRKMGKRDETSLRITGAQSESIKILEHHLQGVLGQGWTDQVKYDKALKGFLQYSSFMGIGLNFSAWANNWWYGTTQQWLETWGGNNMWDRADMRRARKTVFSHAVEMVRTRGGRVKATSKTVGLLNFLDITMDQRELPVGGAELSEKLYDLAYIGQTLGEVGMQSQIALAMMYKQQVRMADGSSVALIDALEYDANTGKVILPKNAKMIKPDGQEVALTMQELGAFKEKTISILQKIHGAYNREDLGRWHRHWVGQLVFQFRKWVPMAMKRRFGSDIYNQAREQNEIGYYNALWKEVIWKTIAGETNGKRFRFYATYKSYANQPHIQAAVRKAMYEHIATLVVAGMAALAHALIEIDDDDDDEFWAVNDEFYKAKLLYHLDRLEMELAQYTPNGVVDFATKFGQDPAAGVRTAKTLYKFSQQLAYAASPFHEVETFQGGAHYGDSKLSTYGFRLVPGVKQYLQLQDAVSSYQVYKLS